MKTTLWFTPEELENGMLDCLIACGQYTTCWNLLEYIEKLKKDNSNTDINHKEIIALEGQLKNYWENFQKDPFYLIKKKR